MATLQLGYWHSRGWAHPIRQLLYITKLDFENVTWGDKEGWLAKKAEIFGDGTELPNCPFLKDGDFVITESSAIPYYVANKAGRDDLLGKDLKDKTRVRQIQGIGIDLMASMTKHLKGNATVQEAATATSAKGGATYTR